MLYVVAIPVLILTLIASFVCLYLLEAQLKNAVQVKKKHLLTSIDDMKASFKTDMQQLVIAGILSTQGLEVAYRIINYYFVFQPVTNDNVQRYEYLLNALLHIINEIQVCYVDAPDSVQESLNQFLQSLPSQSTGYNAGFYTDALPALISSLATSISNTKPEQTQELHDENNAAEVSLQP